MSRTVFCRKYQSEQEGLARPPFPGPKGQDIYDNVSKQAWQEWLHEQTMLINEKQLSMASADDRKYLQIQMNKFLNNEEFHHAEGYVPPDE